MLSNKEIKVENIGIEVELFNSEDFVSTNEENDIFDSEASTSTVENELLTSGYQNDISDPPIRESFKKVRRVLIVNITIFYIFISF